MPVKIFYPPYSQESSLTLAAPNWYSEDGKGSMRGGKYLFAGGYENALGSDWLISGDCPYQCFFTDIPVSRRVLFLDEPPEIREYKYYPEYINQYGIIVSPYEIPGYIGKTIISNPHLGWTAGASGEMDSLTKARNYSPPCKTKTISMITSLKHKTEYHRKRADFMYRVKSELGDVIECFGREFRPVADKIEAIAPYKYHIAIENSRHKYYWTEKLTDAWACWSLPLYFGDPAILEQIPDRRGIELIDADDVPGSIAKIRRIIDDDIYSSRLDAIRTCREWALRASNRYELMCDIIDEAGNVPDEPRKVETFRIMLSKRKNVVYKLLRGISSKFADEMFDAFCRKKGWFHE